LLARCTTETTLCYSQTHGQMETQTTSRFYNLSNANVVQWSDSKNQNHT